MSNRLPHLQDMVQQAHQASLGHTASAATRALEAGALLVEAKALVRHGSWGVWLRTTGIPERTAQRYMVLARSGITTAMVADLGQEAAADMATLGLRLWPRAGIGFYQDLQIGATVRSAVWYLDASRMVRYGYVDIPGDPCAAAEACTMRPFQPVWFLGHLHRLTMPGAGSPQEVTEAEAAALWAELRGSGA